MLMKDHSDLLVLPNAHGGSFRFAGSDRSAYRAENCPDAGVRSSWGSCSGLSWSRSTIILGIVVIDWVNDCARLI